MSVDRPMPASVPGVESPPASALVCTRCGGFVGADQPLLRVATHQWCPACAELQSRQLRLYPHGYVVAMGALLNVVTAAVLLALNWRRLGLRDKERRMWIAAAVAGVAFAGLLAFANPVGGLGIGLNLGVSWALAREYGRVWKPLKARGFPKANLLWPVLFSVAAALAAGVLFVLLDELELGGQDAVYEPG